MMAAPAPATGSRQSVVAGQLTDALLFDPLAGQHLSFADLQASVLLVRLRGLPV